ncbi:hypothetical protein [Actinomycetospora sp. NBRC 106375]|uniref:hypothetical protein n=1 Tax=Actinomycetospora sp. NBRC 106375 TaxID=3032207 RepID=UPI0025546AAD|nr:hypothetical protein [Actinomycetospora sp. NBRC 106375]
MTIVNALLKTLAVLVVAVVQIPICCVMPWYIGTAFGNPQRVFAFDYLSIFAH